MAWAFVQDNSASGLTVTLTGIAAGNLIVVGVKYEDADATGDIAVTDGTAPLDAGGTHLYFLNSIGTSVFYKLISIGNAGVTTFTVSTAAAIAFPVAFALELDYGTDTASFDTNNQANGTSDAPSSGVITTTGSTIAAVGFHGNYSGETSSNELIGASAASNVERVAGASLWWKDGGLVASAASATIGSASWGAHILSFNATAGGGGITTEYVAPTVLQAGVAMIGRRYV